MKATLKGRFEADKTSAVTTLAVPADNLHFKISTTEATIAKGPSLNDLALTLKKPSSFVVDYNVPKEGGDIKFWEAEGIKIDPASKKVHCRSNSGTNLDVNDKFSVDYDYLIITTGARANTFNTPGVEEHCHFLKEVEDALKVRESVMDCFERASLPNISDERRMKDLHFVIVGGGPTGVEFAAELNDFVSDDLSKLYPTIRDLVKIMVIEAGEHALIMFDRRITKFAEEKFQRDGIDVKTGFKVVKVSDQDITMKSLSSGETSVSYGMVVWSTGIGTHPVILDFIKQIGQDFGSCFTMQVNHVLAALMDAPVV